MKFLRNSDFDCTKAPWGVNVLRETSQSMPSLPQKKLPDFEASNLRYKPGDYARLRLITLVMRKMSTMRAVQVCSRLNARGGNSGEIQAAVQSATLVA